MSDNTKCELCLNRKYVLKNGKWNPCKCLLAQRKLILYARSNIPHVFHNYTWSDFFNHHNKMKNIAPLCKSVVKKVKAKERCKYLYVQGNSNSGKQSLVSLLLKEFIDANLTTKFISLDDLIKMEFDKDNQEELRKIYTQYDVVSLRIGTVMEHSYARYVLEKFYNDRRNRNLYGIFTSRLGIEENESLYGIEMKTLMSDGRRIHKIIMRI